MNDRVIPVEAWVWFGHSAHFCGSDDCMFKMATKVGDYIISSIGDWYDRVEKKFKPVGSSGMYYETMVFLAGEEYGCGCVRPATYAAIDTNRYEHAQDAQEGHMRMCRKYAGLDDPADWQRDKGLDESARRGLQRVIERYATPEGKTQVLIDTAARVCRKFGSDCDWTEWQDLRDALLSIDPNIVVVSSLAE